MHAKSIDIRTFASADTLPTIELFRNTVHVVGKDVYSKEQLSAWAPADIDAEKWKSRLAGAFTIVAWRSDKIVGFANLLDDGCVDLLYVAADHQGQGIASALLKTLENEATRRGVKKLYSDVSLTARKFFLAKCFVIEKEYSKKLRDVEFPNAIMGKVIG
jgi:putative acetyltransferase